MRRGAPSANARWSNNIAILAGDYLFATASRLVSRLGPDAVRVIADTFAQLVTGQMRETRGAAEHVDAVEHYLKVVYEKTACLIAASGRFGGDVLRRRRGADRAAEPARRHRRHGVPDLRRHHRHRQRSRRVRQGARHRPARGRAHAAGALRAARNRARTRTGCASCWRARSRTTTTLAEALELLRRSPGMAQAKDTVARYAAQARDELANLPGGPGSAGAGHAGGLHGEPARLTR